EAEAASVRAWLAEHPESARGLTALDERLAGLAVPPAHVDVEAALARVHARMEEPVVLTFSPRPASTGEQRRRGWRSIAVAIAATVLVVVGGVVVWRTLQSRAGTVNVYATAVGRVGTIRLADGSTVILAPSSRLTVPGDYGRGERTVELSGQALFQVRHDAREPFAVRAGSAVVRDIGTEFVVSQDSSGSLDVVVQSGSVSLAVAAVTDTPVVLRAGERGSLQLNRIVRERARPADTAVEWTRGRLVFDDAGLDRVRSDLRRWYGVKLEVADSALANRHVTASFAGEPVQQVVDVIALALGARVEWRGNTAVLQAAPAGNGP
ncbi:MAG TPA: FecR domain-containing protein, partial [Longimicrobiales bacterium]